MGAVHRIELGRHIDNAAPALLDHRRRRAPGHLVGRDIIGLDDGAHDVVRDLPEFLRLVAAKARRVDRREGQAGIVDEDVRPAEALLRHRDDAVAFGRETQIGDERQDLPREVGAGSCRLDLHDLCVDVADGDDIVTLADEAERHRPPQAPQARS